MKTVLSLIALTPNKFGSYEEFEVQLAHTMTQLGWRSIKIFNDLPTGKLLDAFLEAGCQLDTLPKHCSVNSILAQAAVHFRNYKPDLLHISFYPVSTPLSILAWICGIKKIIITDHFSGMPQTYSIPKEFLRFLRNKLLLLPTSVPTFN